MAGPRGLKPPKVRQWPALAMRPEAAASQALLEKPGSHPQP